MGMMVSKIYRFIWSIHSCFSEVVLFTSSKRFFKRIRFYFRALAKEDKAMNLKHKCRNLNKIVLVGAGPIPYTALYFRKRFHQVICIEKNRILAAMAKAFIKSQRVKNISVVLGDAIDYDFTDNSLIYICLLTQGKEAIVKKASKSNNSLLCVRIPDVKGKHRYENVQVQEKADCAINVPQLAMQSILINTNNIKQLGGNENEDI